MIDSNIEKRITKPLISVITPTYKRFEHIEQAIKSVLFQDYPKIEYIITDDGSENFPHKKINDYIQENRKKNLKAFTIITNEQNIGTVKNLNNAYKQAHGKYIINLADDDEFLSNDVVSKLISRIMELDCTVMISSRLICQKGKTYLLPHILHTKMLKKYSNRKLYSLFVSGYNYTMSSGSAFTIDREKFLQCGCYDENFVLLEDKPFAAKMLKQNMLKFAHDIVSIKYNLGGISTSKIINPKLKKDYQLFNYTYRTEDLNYILPFYRKFITLSNAVIDVESKIKRRIFWALHPLFFFFIVFYKLRNNIALLYDTITLRKKGY